MLCKTILFLLILSGDCQGWWSSSNQRASPNDAEGNSEGRNSGNAKQTRVNFEVLSAEEKFLAQAKQYMDLSPLDLCHQKVPRKDETIDTHALHFGMWSVCTGAGLDARRFRVTSVHRYSNLRRLEYLWSVVH